VNTSPLRALALVGATGTGKSALALRWAERTGNCIISCDSMQVYRGLNIGTAKATADEQARVRHALIDVIDLPYLFSAAQWADAARYCIAEENNAGRVPIICGGTGFYLRTLLSGIASIPNVEDDIRQRLNQRLHTEGHAALFAYLQQVDTVTAGLLSQGDSQRVLRALSVFEATGIPLSIWQQQSPTIPTLHCPLLWLQKPRPQLRDDVAVRFHQMMAVGWLDEVQYLKATGCDSSHPAMRAVGYRQLLEYLAGSYDKNTAIQQGITATRRYAKRQETWFRHQLHADVAGTAAIIEEYLLSHTTANHL